MLRSIARGYAYKEIARELHISVKMVESHVGGFLRKLQLTNRYDSAVGRANESLLRRVVCLAAIPAGPVERLGDSELANAAPSRITFGAHWATP